MLQAQITDNSGYAQDCVKYAKKNFNRTIWFNYNDKLKERPEKDFGQLGAVIFEEYSGYGNHMEQSIFEAARRATKIN